MSSDLPDLPDLPAFQSAFLNLDLGTLLSPRLGVSIVFLGISNVAVGSVEMPSLLFAFISTMYSMGKKIIDHRISK